MGRSIEGTSIISIGTGDLATNLAKIFYDNGFHIIQVYSRTEEPARALAQVVEVTYTTNLPSVVTDAQLYTVSLKDMASIQLLSEIVVGKENALWVHIAGSIPTGVWVDKMNRYGVLHPMQTFNKQCVVDFQRIPIFVEGNSEADARFLKAAASVLSK